MNDRMNRDEIQQILSVLGAEGVLDTLLCVKGHDWVTASEIAGEMNTHVATAVKRLSGLYEIGILDRRVRKGRTRSAQEYSLISSSFGLDIDLDELVGGTSGSTGNSEIYLLLLKDMARRFGKFSGRDVDEIISSWGVQKILDGEKISQNGIIQTITDVLEMEAEEYGELTVKSLAAASLDAINDSEIIQNLPKKYFGVRK